MAMIVEALSYGCNDKTIDASQCLDWLPVYTYRFSKASIVSIVVENKIWFSSKKC